MVTGYLSIIIEIHKKNNFLCIFYNKFRSIYIVLYINVEIYFVDKYNIMRMGFTNLHITNL